MTKADEKAGEGAPSAPPLNADQQELSKILKTLRHDPTFMGCFSLGTDGVLRSLTADRDVVDAIALSPRFIKAIWDRMPFDQKTEDEYRGVDGTTVPREQWFRPDKSLLPPPMSEKRKEETRKKIEENRKVFGERMNYNLEEKQE
jgi:hypothetical protein